MTQYHITTDSTADMTVQHMEELGIAFASLHVHLDGREFLDDMLPETTERIFRAMHEGKVPTTSQVTVEDFIQMWEPILQSGDDVLFIGLAGVLSGTMNSAYVAATQLTDRYPNSSIRIVDSVSGSASEGVLLEHAAELKRGGLTLDACYKAIEDLKQQVNMWFTVGDLAYLRRGGRVSGAAAAIATLLHIKPVMEASPEGKLLVREKVKGRRAAIKRLYEQLCERINIMASKLVHITHAECLEDAKELARSISARFPELTVRIYPVGAVIGAHGGPGTLTLAYVGKKREA